VRTGGIVAGIEWAVVNGCRVVSMSLGANINQKLQQYEVPIQRALNAGALVIAAPGTTPNGLSGTLDSSRRPRMPTRPWRWLPWTSSSRWQTSRPGAVLLLELAEGEYRRARSARVLERAGRLGTHGVLSGTSMATPHVSGIAALWLRRPARRAPRCGLGSSKPPARWDAPRLTSGSGWFKHPSDRPGVAGGRAIEWSVSPFPPTKPGVLLCRRQYPLLSRSLTRP